jgi:DNA polymerase III sliding clamp (beta) subunit (PCNA family)
MAEDVVDHLSIEMLKHLDAIQAQGDKLAGVNTDADFEREQRAQLDMREEDSIEEGISTSDITKALKDDAKATDSEIKQYMASVKKAGDKFDDVDDYVEDFKNYVADKSLQEHFGRFMKDYQ